MSARNQVTPSGTLVTAAPGSRGLLMGNRGILLPRHYELDQPNVKGKPWISCVLKDKDGIPLARTEVKYTRLFFLDEVTAFAAGHRPCGQCQKKRYGLFVETWGKATKAETKTMDAHLHSERCGGSVGGNKTVVARKLGELPDGTMVTFEPGGQPHLLLCGNLIPWTVGGYQHPVTYRMATEVQVLTPLSIVSTFQAGFPLPLTEQPTVHSSALVHLG